MTIIAAANKCDATNTRVGINEWGTHGIPCQTRVGLRSFVDREGTTRFHCSVPEHKRNVERRFGRQSACFLCGKTRMVDLGLYTRVVIGDSVALLCECREKGDEEGDSE